MKKIALLTIIAVLVLGGASGVVLAKPAVPAADIEVGVFVDYGYSSPPWYPFGAEENDNYRWAPRIYWAMGDLPIDVTVYTGNAPILETFAEIQTAFTMWQSATSTQIFNSITENGTPEAWPGIDPTDGNTVAWDQIDGSGGIIGVTYYWYNAATKQMIGFDMILDSGDGWSTSGAADHFDVRNVVTHEVGHTLVLSDLQSPRDAKQTMHAYTWRGDTLKRDLAPGDVLGIQAIYGQ